MNYNESWIEKTFRQTYEKFKSGNPDVCNWIGYDPQFILDQEYPVQLKTGKIYFIDFFEPTTSLAIELDGFNYHHTPKQMMKDLKRDAELTKIGFTIIRIPGSEIRREPIVTLYKVYNKYCSLIFKPKGD